MKNKASKLPLNGILRKAGKKELPASLGGIIDEREIIRRVRQGDRNAYAFLVDKYRNKMLGYCLQILGEESRAEDAAQEVFVKAYQSLENFLEESSFSTWLYRIAANHCKDLLRKAKRDRMDSWDEMIEKEGEKFEFQAMESHSDASVKKHSEDLLKALALLSEEERSILVLREINGFSYKELAEITLSSVDSIKGRLKRIRKKLIESQCINHKPVGDS